MAAITIVAGTVRCARRADEHQHTAPVLVAILAGQYVRWDPTTGKFDLGNATLAAEVGDGYIAENDAGIGEALTALKGPAVLDVGDSLSALNYGDSVFLGDVDGQLNTVAGTVSTVVGKVVPGWAGSAKKLLRLILN